MQVTVSGSAGLVSRVTGRGPTGANILILLDSPTYNDAVSGTHLSDYYGQLLLNQFRRAGVNVSSLRIESICENMVGAGTYLALPELHRAQWESHCRERLLALSSNVIVAVGEGPLRFLTGKTGIHNWQCSVVWSEEFNVKVVPVFTPQHVNRAFSDIFFLFRGVLKAVNESATPVHNVPQRTFFLQPTFELIANTCERYAQAPEVSIDIETANGQITCIGFACGPNEAISIPTRIADWDSAERFYAVWKYVAMVCEASNKKIFQNGIYDTTYLSAYGIRVRGFAVGHDTMHAQRILEPEQPVGLDTIARLHTSEPYWKDEAKDWSTKTNLLALYSYNAKDAACTFEAKIAQENELRKRGLLELFRDYQMRLAPILMEMSWRGLPVDMDARAKALQTAEAELAQLMEQFQAQARLISGEEVNPRSPVQVKNLLKRAGMRLPTKHGKETTDVLALKKLRLKHPDMPVLDLLIKVSAEQKAISSYLKSELSPDTVLRYTLNGAGTETLRWSCYKDPWDRGVNAQTIPSKWKTFFPAPQGRTYINVDLKQADGRFVAWDAAEPTLLEMYRSGIDIHKVVAGLPEIFNCAPEVVTKPQRELGKRVGHAANYGMGARTLQDTCLKQMDLVISEAKAQQGLWGYYRKFAGIPAWQNRIKNEVALKRELSNPLGYVRRFYGRQDDHMFKEAYAFRPQSTVAKLINHLALFMRGHVWLHLQIHDALLMSVPDDAVLPALERIKDQDGWNPKLQLTGGELRIPIEVSIGKTWKNTEVVFSG